MDMRNTNYVGIMKMNKYIIKQLLSLIDEYDGRFTKQDYHVLGQLYRVVNFCVDRNGCYHGDDGKFIEKNGGAGVKFETVQLRPNVYKRLHQGSLEQIKSYMFPNGIGDNMPEKKRASLLFASVGLCNEDIAECLNRSRAYVKLVMSKLQRDFGARNRTDLVIKAIETGAVKLDEIPTFQLDKKYAVLGSRDYLTRSEKEFIIYVAAGCNNVEIAKLRNVSLETIKTQSEKVFFKYGVGDRTVASVFALKNGDITFDDIRLKRQELYQKI